MVKKIAAVISLLMGITLLTAMPANAAVPSLTSISPEIGSVTGGTALTITGTDFTGATGVTIGGVAGTSFSVDSDTQISVTTPARTGNDAAIGRAPVVVQHADGNSDGTDYFTYSPDWDFTQTVTGSGLDKIVTLGALASRTQGNPIVRSTVAPFTVTGTDSLSGEAYSYTYGKQNPGNFVGDAAYSVEGVESTLSGSDSFSSTKNESATYLSRSAVELTMNANSINQTSGVSPFGTIFGPELYTEPFYASSSQSLSFSWAAKKITDAYEVYAFLVEVSGSTIPTPSTSNHTLVLHNQGNDKEWTTAGLAVPRDGTYRLRFVNGSYDETGGLAVGNRFYVTQTLLSGLANEISFGPLADFAASSPTATTTVTASATSGEEVTVASLTTSVCTVGGQSHNSGTGVTSWTVTRVNGAEDQCLLVASQGSVGLYGPASDVQASFAITTGAGEADAPVYFGPVVTQAYPKTVVEGTGTQITLSGTNLESVTQLRIDGQNIEFTRINNETLSFTMPQLAAGNYDVTTLSSFGTAMHVNILEVLPAPVEAEKKEPIRVVVTGFRGGVSTPTQFQIDKLQRGIDAIDEEITGITCVGYTNGPTVLPNDPQVALGRASLICDYLKTVFPDLEQKLTYFNTTRESVHWRRAEAYFRID